MVFFPLICTGFLIFRSGPKPRQEFRNVDVVHDGLFVIVPRHDEISKRVNEDDGGRETERVRGSTLEATAGGL